MINFLRRFLIIFLVIVVLFTVFLGWEYKTRPIVNEVITDRVVVENDPIQKNDLKFNNVILDSSKGNVILIPQAQYEISALVVGRKNYHFHFEDNFIPTDLALAWGKLADLNYNQDISYSQSGRWYFYRYGPDTKLPESYISGHSANVHIVPATENIKKAVKKIKKGQLIRIEGFLVNIEAENFGRKTSLIRTDSGAGSCEIVYVIKIQINDKAYW